MTDIERLLAEALRESGEDYEPSDQAEARRRFLERARRRRWYGFAQAAAFVSVGVGAFVFFMYFAGTEKTVEPQPEVAGAPEIVATVEVGGDPVSIDATTGSEVWVAGSDRLIAIDPDTERTGALIIDLPADEVAVGDGVLWAAHDGSTGTITEIDPETGPVVGKGVSLDAEAGTEITWDIAAVGESLVAVDGVSDRIYVLGPRKDETVVPGYQFTDVTTSSDGDVWALDQAAGALVHVDAATREPIGGPIEVPAGENADLIAGFQYVYLSPGNGTLYQITPPGTTDMIEADLGDSYMDLTVHEKSVWALVNVDEEHKQLFEINPGTMEVIGEPLEIEGDANDVVAAAGSVWVADGRGEVLRIEPSRDADDAPPPADEEDNVVVEPSPEGEGPFMFVYSANGDLFGENQDGTVFQLTDTPEIEQHPSFAPDGNSIVFEREHADEGPDGGTEDSDVVQFHLGTGEEEVIGSGSWPTLSSDGRLASVSTSTEIDENPAAAIMITRDPSDPESAVANIAGTLELPNISHLSWSPDGESLVYQAAGEGTVIKQSEVDGLELSGNGYTLVPTEDAGGSNESSDFQEGSNLVSPHATSNGVLVLRLCCRDTEGDPFEEEMNIGRVRQDIEGVSYEDIGGAGGKPGIDATFATQFVPAGRLVLMSGDGHNWNPSGPEPTWFVFDHDSLWLNQYGGITQYVSGQDTAAPAPGHEGETDFRGLAVHPSLLD